MAVGIWAGWLVYEASSKSKHAKTLPTSRSTAQYPFPSCETFRLIINCASKHPCMRGRKEFCKSSRTRRFGGHWSVGDVCCPPPGLCRQILDLRVWVTEDKAASPGIWTVNRNKLAGHSQGLASQEMCSTLSSLGTPVYMPATILIASLSRCHVKQYFSLLEGIGT